MKNTNEVEKKYIPLAERMKEQNKNLKIIRRGRKFNNKDNETSVPEHIKNAKRKEFEKYQKNNKGNEIPDFWEDL